MKYAKIETIFKSILKHQGYEYSEMSYNICKLAIRSKHESFNKNH